MGMTGDEPPPPVAVAPAPKKDLDLEAQSMFDRAREYAKAGRTDQAISLLETMVKSYKGTRTADEASKALERPKQNLPLFLDRPAVNAEPAPKPAPPPETQPTQVVTAQPKQTTGNATLTLPANPAELTPTHPSPLAMASTTAGAGKTPTTVRILPSGFTAKSEAGIHSSGWPLAILGNRDGAPMVLVPGGTFTMGNDSGSTAEAPAHKVSLSTYYIDQHEVTVRQFRLFLAEMHYRGQPPRSWSEAFRQNPSETLPMVMVNARDAQAYSEWALKQMPTEAQWELAVLLDRRPALPLGFRAHQPGKAAYPGPGRAGHVGCRGRLSLWRSRFGGERPGVDERLVRFQVLPPAIQPARGEPHRTDRQAEVSGARGQGRSEVRQRFGPSGDHAGKAADLCRFPLCPAGRRQERCRQSGIPGSRNVSRTSASRSTASEPSAAG